MSFQYITCIGSSRADLSLRNITSEFQYITCIGSRYKIAGTASMLCCFNTLHVSVQVKYIAIK